MQKLLTTSMIFWTKLAYLPGGGICSVFPFRYPSPFEDGCPFSDVKTKNNNDVGDLMPKATTGDIF